MYNLDLLRVAALSLPSLLLLFPVEAVQGQQFQLRPYRPDSYWVPSPDRQAQHVMSMRQRQGKPSSAGYLQALQQGSQVQGVYGNTELNSTDSGTAPLGRPISNSPVLTLRDRSRLRD